MKENLEKLFDESWYLNSMFAVFVRYNKFVDIGVWIQFYALK